MVHTPSPYLVVVVDELIFYSAATPSSAPVQSAVVPY
jgi:hypothetical protein